MLTQRSTLCTFRAEIASDELIKNVPTEVAEKNDLFCQSRLLKSALNALKVPKIIITIN